MDVGHINMIDQYAFTQAYKVFEIESERIVDMLVSHSYSQNEREAAKLNVYRKSIEVYLYNIYYGTEKELTLVDSELLLKAYESNKLIKHNLNIISHDIMRKRALENIISIYIASRL